MNSARSIGTRYELFSSLNFGPVTDGETDGQTESDACEPTMHKHSCAQKAYTNLKCPSLWDGPNF